MTSSSDYSQNKAFFRSANTVLTKHLLAGIIDVMKYPVVILIDESGYFVAECPVLPGCFSQGKSREEALENIREAIELAVETRIAQGNALPEVIRTPASEEFSSCIYSQEFWSQ